MTQRYNNRSDEFPKRERPRSAKEIRLFEILKYWGFHTAASNMDTRHMDLDAAIASWSNYPKCMDAYPAVITRKVKLDPKEIPDLVV